MGRFYDTLPSGCCAAVRGYLLAGREKYAIDKQASCVCTQRDDDVYWRCSSIISVATLSDVVCVFFLSEKGLSLLSFYGFDQRSRPANLGLRQGRIRVRATINISYGNHINRAQMNKIF